MSDLINEKILEQLFEKYLEQGYLEIEAAKLAKKEFEENDE
jgi:predicted outer membrane protein